MRSNSKWFWIGGAILVLALLLMWVGNRTPGGDTDQLLAVSDSDWTRGGSAAAPATLIEYGDFQCPACGAYYPFVKQLEADFGSDLRIVFRHFPLMEAHPNAIPGALAAEAAGKQGKFWEMYDILYQKQTEWSLQADAKPKFAEYATMLGLNKDQFMADMDDPALLEKIRSSRSNGEKIGLRGTPTFYLNGKHIESPQDYPAFRDLVAATGAKLGGTASSTTATSTATSTATTTTH